MLTYTCAVLLIHERKTFYRPLALSLMSSRRNVSPPRIRLLPVMNGQVERMS